MREVAPGDLVFSFVDTRIVAIGIADSYCYESPKPAEFGQAGMNWEKIGWRVRVRFTTLAKGRPQSRGEGSAAADVPGIAVGLIDRIGEAQ